MVICRVLSHVSTQLGHLDLRAKLPLEASIDDLSLAWFEAVHDGRYGPHVVRDREVDELFVYEVLVRELLDVVIDVGLFVGITDPGLPLVGQGL